MSKRKLLLADDSVTIQKVVNLTFADEGIDVIAVGDGDSAMQKISEVSPDVVLADVHMPGLSGYQICERLRANPDTRDLPVVLLVGSFEPFDEGEAERVGANAYLTKPFQSIRQLVSQVSDLIDRPAVGEDTDPTIEVQHERAAAAVADEADPEDDAPDTTDIESLYNESLSTPGSGSDESSDASYGVPADGTPESSFAAEASAGSYKATDFGDRSFESDVGGHTAVPFGDVGMDDEMIEARRAEDDESWASAAGEPDHETLDDVPVDANEPPYTIGDSAPDVSDEVSGSGSSPFDSLATASEHQAGPTFESDSEQESYFDRFANTEEIRPSDLPATSEFQLDEIELLELPPIENGKTLEFTTTQSMLAQGGNKQVVSLSPELMDEIVQKVMEKLSEKY